MDLVSQYKIDTKRRAFIPNVAQQQAVEQIEILRQCLLAYVEVKGARSRWLRFWQTPPHCKGIYFWGDVGRGKTYLMDLLYGALPFRKKLRSHYDEFMQSIHHALDKLPKQPNPLIQIAKDISDQAYILCLDEFHVQDITDAMILYGLLGALFDRHVCLVMTSNQAPNVLYQDGLQREAFLPAIALLESNTQVFHLVGDTDYRKRNAKRFPCYQHPHLPNMDQQLSIAFSALTPERSIQYDTHIKVQNRQISAKQVGDNAIWFNFSSICGTSRSSLDYIELSKRFPIFFITAIPQLGDDNNDATLRFIKLIDTLYDQHRWVMLTASIGLDNLYTGRDHNQTFVRIQSRIHEMQTQQYLRDCKLSHPIDLLHL